MRKLLCAAAVCAFITPALGQEYYVVQDVKTKRCTIVSEKPTTTTTVTQVGPVVFKTREEAQAGLRKIKVCESN
jgi:hypothetical protein